MPILPRSASKSGDITKLRKMSINSNDDDQTTSLLITKPSEDDDQSHQPNVDDDDDDAQQSQPPSTPIPKIYSNDFDFNIENSLKLKACSRSFIRPAKTLSQEHRNRSVPHNLQV